MEVLYGTYYIAGKPFVFCFTFLPTIFSDSYNHSGLVWQILFMADISYCVVCQRPAFRLFVSCRLLLMTKSRPPKCYGCPATQNVGTRPATGGSNLTVYQSSPSWPRYYTLQSRNSFPPLPPFFDPPAAFFSIPSHVRLAVWSQPTQAERPGIAELGTGVYLAL